MIISFQMKPFGVVRDEERKRDWLVEVRVGAIRTLREGIQNGPHTGERHASLMRRSSKEGEYPASQTGNLLASIRSQQLADEIAIGTNTPYSGFLAAGTKHMGPRKMSAEALRTAREAAGLVRMFKWQG